MIWIKPVSRLFFWRRLKMLRHLMTLFYCKLGYTVKLTLYSVIYCFTSVSSSTSFTESKTLEFILDSQRLDSVSRFFLGSIPSFPRRPVCAVGRADSVEMDICRRGIRTKVKAEEIGADNNCTSAACFYSSNVVGYYCSGHYGTKWNPSS